MEPSYLARVVPSGYSTSSFGLEGLSEHLFGELVLHAPEAPTLGCTNPDCRTRLWATKAWGWWVERGWELLDPSSGHGCCMRPGLGYTVGPGQRACG